MINKLQFLEKRGFVLLMLCIASFSASSDLFAQQHQLISSGGGDHGTGTLRGSYSIGEPLITTGGNSELKLTQGFHQNNLFTTSIREDLSSHSLKMYPNPFSNAIRIELSEGLEIHSLDFYNVQGILLESIRQEIHNRTLITLDMSHLPVGWYIVTAKDKSGTPFQRNMLFKSL
jgi:hypothetical protein